MLKIIQSTDPQTLFDRFADDLQQSRRSVFDRATVIVPSMTVRDDLDNRLADRHGISALLDAKFFGMFAWALVEKVTDSQALDSHPPLSRAAMQWRMFAVFATRLDMPPENAMDTLLAELTQGIAEADVRLKRLWQLAGQLAKIFVRYLHMRADWLTLWSQGQGADLPELFTQEEWQKIAEQPDWMHAHYAHICAAQQAIWRNCFAEAFLARAARLDAFWQTLATKPVDLPNPLFVYALESVDADMYAFLQRLAEYTDIYVYHHAVSEGYFGDMVDDRWLRRLQQAGTDTNQHYDSIHPLLSRFGKQHRDLFRQWIEPENDNTRTYKTLNAPHPPATTLLATLQAEIRALDPALLQDYPLDNKDDSLRIHACHGLMRQLEALRGELVRWFAEDSSRQPSDVLIVLPELEEAQNLVRTVFPPSGQYDGHTLPARLTGITPPAAQNLWQAVEGLYTLPDSRFEAERVLAWLRREEVCTMLDMPPTAMNRLCDALLEAGYRRGLDDQQLGNPDGDSRFTFCYALDRLITGLWMPSAPIYGNTIPQPEYDSHGLAALCQLALDWQTAWHHRTQTKPVREWVAYLQQTINDRFPDLNNARRTIDLALRELDGQIAALEPHAVPPPVTLSFVLTDIGARLSSELSSSEPSGVMTIGRIGAMRSLSYKLIAFVGANVGDFPTNPPDDRYDLSRLGHKRLGDIHPEHEDLAAFLDILRHAREALWIFYDQYAPGNSEEQLPAQPVQELLQYLKDHDINPEALTRKHPADPFQADAKDHHPAPLWQSVRDSSRENRAATPFVAISTPDLDLTKPVENTENISFDVLRRHILKPLASYLRHHELASERNLHADPALEPLHLDPLQRHALDEHLITQADDPRLIHLPLLPAGVAGKILLANQQKVLQARRAQLLANSGYESLPVFTDQAVTLDNLTITLPLPSAGEPHLVLLPNKKRDKHLLTVWLRHLLWLQQGGRGETWGAFADELHVFEYVPDYEEHLRAWLNVRAHSLQQPWLLPVEVGMAWDDNNPEKALKAWQNTEYPADDPEALALISRGHTPSDIHARILAHAEHYTAPLYTPITRYSKK